MFENCTICPRNCNVNRNKGETGFCHSDSNIKVARAALHYWEEPCISGENGSGAVFFSGCSLGCIFCQNRAISRGETGKIISIERLCEIFFELKSKGANNINLVTGDHYIPMIREAIILSKKKGFDLPFIFNCSGYERVEQIRMLEGLIDVYLPDMKYFSGDLSSKYSNAKDYFQIACEAIEEMFRQQPKIIFDDNGIIQNGVIVRHLVLPGCTDDSERVITYLYETYGEDIILSLMNQYTPLNDRKLPDNLNRKLTEDEYDKVIDFAVDIGVENAYVQEDGTVSESFIPEFDNEGV